MFVRLPRLATKWAAAGAVACILAASLGFGWYRRNHVSNDPFVVAREYRDALLSGDVAEFYRLADHHEIDVNGMSQADVSGFLKDWLRPKLVRVLDDSDEVLGTGSNGFQSFSWGIATSAGRFPISISVDKTEAGLRVVQPLTSLFITFAAIKDNHLPATGVEKLRFYLENARKMEPELARYHFTMLELTPNAEPMSIGQFESWTETRYRGLTATSPAAAQPRRAGR